MIFLLGSLSADGSRFQWHVSKTKGTSARTGVKITLSFHEYATPYVARELMHLTEEALAMERRPWLQVHGGAFSIDCKRMRDNFPILGEQDWMKNVVRVMPDIRIESEKHKSFHGDERTVYPATIAFYLDERTESAEWMIPSTVPQSIHASLARFRDDHPDMSRTGFVIMHFGDTPAHEKITEAIKSTLRLRKLEGVRSDEKSYDDDLLANVLTYAHGCGFAVAVFERIERDDFNPNVALEVGYMMALGKPVCYLKDRTLSALHTDLIGRLYTPFDPQDIEATVNTNLSKWLDDKRIG